MSTRELAYFIFNQLSEEQLQAFVTLFEKQFPIIPEEEPDEFDRALIADSKVDNDEFMNFDDFTRSLGFDPAELGGKAE